MKNRISGFIFAGLMATFSTVSLAQEKNSVNVFSASSYLNFYLMNLNACEEFHPSLQLSALEAERVLYPFLQKLEVHTNSAEIGDKEKAQLKNLLIQRKTMINEQIASGELTLEHCQTVINIVSSEGLDKALLDSL